MPNQNPDLTIAHITAPDGAIFQVLNAEGDDWDEALTKVQYDIYLAAHPE